MIGLITYISIILALAIGTWIRPAIGIGAVLCLYGLKQWGQSSTFYFSQHTHNQFANYAVFIICIMGVVRAAQRRGCVFCKLPTTAALVVGLLLYAFITISWAPDPETSLKEWLITGPYIITITLLAPLLLENLDDARVAFLSTALAGAALCGLALAFGHWGDRGLLVFGHEAAENGNNIYLYETNPLALSSMAGTVFLISALSLGRPNRPLMRLFALAAIPIALGVVLRSGSRGQVIASGISLVVAFPIILRSKEALPLRTLFFTAAAVIGLGWWGAMHVNIDSSRWSANHASEAVEGRFEMAQKLLKASTSDFFSALFGLGNSSSFKVVGIYPHIAGLEILAEEGIIGATIYGAILLLALRSVLRLSARDDLTEARRNGLAILTALFLFELIISWKQGSLLFSIYVFCYAIILARLETPSTSSVRVPQQRSTVLARPRFDNLLN
jgi:hypothetical protein